MSRDLNQLAKLNTVDDNKRDDVKNEAELQMFSDTNFFDLDIGRSTDIATTVDELLMQQEKHIQYPQKQQPIFEDQVAGPSYNPQQQQQLGFQLDMNNQLDMNTQQIPFDFTPFSLADELPQASISIMDIDPLFHQQQVTQPQPQPQPQQQQQSERIPATSTYRRNPPMQRHELAEMYAPRSGPVPLNTKTHTEQDRRRSSVVDTSGSGTDDEKRRRNTAASARFRIKKKLREQEMEKNLKSMQQKITDQEERIKQLEMENSWLKNLVVERNTERDSSSLGKLRAAFLENKI